MLERSAMVLVISLAAFHYSDRLLFDKPGRESDWVEGSKNGENRQNRARGPYAHLE